MKILTILFMVILFAGCGSPTAPDDTYTVEYSLSSLSDIQKPSFWHLGPNNIVVHYGYYYADTRKVGVDMTAIIKDEWLSETFSVSDGECIFFLRADSDDNVLFSGEIIFNGNKGKWVCYSDESLPYNNINFKIANQ